MHVTSRPQPFQRRRDVQAVPMEFRNERYWIVKDPLQLTYHQLSADQYFVLEQLDGEKSLDEICTATRREFPRMTVDHRAIQHLIIDLHQKGLVLSQRSRQGISMLVQGAQKRRQLLARTLINPFFIRLPGINPRSVLSSLNRWFGWIFSRSVVLLSLLLITWSLAVVAMRRQEIVGQLREFSVYFGWPNLLYLWLTLGFTKVIHELGHGLSCVRFGRECNSIGFAMLVFSPTLYCDATDSWMLPSKWKRICVSSAGMYAEVLLASGAILLWSVLNDGLVRHLCLNIFLVSTVTTVVFNANPLIRFDGYYILSDWLEIPNLRQKATLLLNRTLAWALGTELRPDPQLPSTGRFWFVLYAIASAVYRWLIVLGIFAFLISVLKPYRLQSLGIGWAVISGALMAGGVGRTLWKSVTMKTGHPRNRRRMLVTVLLMTAGLGAILQLPIPFVVASPFVVRPQVEEGVFIVEPGVVDAVHHVAGQRVTSGDALLTLRNPDLLADHSRLATELAVVQAAVQAAAALNDHDQVVIQQQKSDQLQRELQETRERLGELIIRAPIDGVVTAVPRIPEPTIEQGSETLAHWTGSVLDDSSTGAWMNSGTPVATIAGTSECHAELVVDQGNLRDIHPGQQVRLSFDHAPGSVMTGHVVQIAAQHTQFLDPALSNRYGGTIPTIADQQGREQLTSHAYEVIVSLPATELAPVIGMRGRARVIVSEYSLGHWMWRAVRSTFQYRI